MDRGAASLCIIPHPLLLAQVTKLGEVTAEVKSPEMFPAFLTALRDDANLQFRTFIDMTGVDWPHRERRFDVVVHLLSTFNSQRIWVKTDAGEWAPGGTHSGVPPAPRSRPRRVRLPPPQTRSAPSLASLPFSPPHCGQSARPTTCLAYASRATPTCAAS